MDDSFAFRTTVPLHRRLDPSAAKAVVVGTLVVLGIGLFTHWVMASERESFSRGSPGALPTDGAVRQVDGLTRASTDVDAERAIGIALGAAKAVFLEHRSFLDATPAHLNTLQPGYTFVDGPSAMPEIVSVAATADTWAAAVQGPRGTCLWVRATRAGDVTHGIGSVCTGSAALSSVAPR